MLKHMITIYKRERLVISFTINNIKAYVYKSINKSIK